MSAPSQFGQRLLSRKVRQHKWELVLSVYKKLPGNRRIWKTLLNFHYTLFCLFLPFLFTYIRKYRVNTEFCGKSHSQTFICIYMHLSASIRKPLSWPMSVGCTNILSVGLLTVWESTRVLSPFVVEVSSCESCVVCSSVSFPKGPEFSSMSRQHGR